MRLSLTLGTVILSCLAGTVQADEPPTPKAPPPPPPSSSPADMQKTMAAAMDGMVPLMSRMTEAMIGAQLRIAADPQTAENIATFKRNLYEALLKKGFRPEQALALTESTPLPSAGGMGGK